MNTAVFLISAVVCTVVIWLFYQNTKLVNNNVNHSLLRKNLPLTGTAIITLLAISAFSGIINFGPYKNAYIFMSIVCILSCILYYAGEKKLFSESRFSLKMILIASVLELTIFNLPSYKLFFGDYKQVDYPAAQGCIENGGIRNKDGSITVDPHTQLILSFPDQKMQIGTIYTSVKFTGKYVQNAPFEVDVKDSTQLSDYRYGIIESGIVAKRPESQYKLCEFSGNVNGIRIRITSPDNDRLIVNSISFNKPFPIEISYIRFILITVISIFIHMVLKSKILNRSFAESKQLCSFVAFAVTVYACLASFSVINYKLSDNSWLKELKQSKGNQVTQELVDAFESGQINLIEQPEEELLSLNNPYDTSERDKTGVNYSWDHVYYNHNYYSYYGK